MNDKQLKFYEIFCINQNLKAVFVEYKNNLYYGMKGLS